MEIVRTIDWMKQVCRGARAREHVLGFVPTMGAIHEGHLSLVREAKSRCSRVVVSIFVNPAQFGPSEDLTKYPRPFKADCTALESLGVDYVFAPSANEMYPKGFSAAVSVDGIGDRLEGRSRPGHFCGVATVVLKLFEIVQPNFAFFGRKDAQQQALIRQMVRDLDLDAQIVTCPIVREADGLALSSRNIYLNGTDRRAASILYRSLVALREQIDRGERDIAQLLATMQKALAREPAVILDYAEIVDAETFDKVMNLRGSCFAVLAAKVSGTRLIDNALIEQTDDCFTVSL
ncbi:MAG TPA: pantoate--beta-alanine ligase [Candidatus Acidoferrales bacterium]|nr:pantoate--beta-alanine ligase [Candidatus Acidoferrales bacterium]